LKFKQCGFPKGGKKQGKYQTLINSELYLWCIKIVQPGCPCLEDISPLLSRRTRPTYLVPREPDILSFLCSIFLQAFKFYRTNRNLLPPHCSPSFGSDAEEKEKVSKA
jgi:hypothetical protein